MNGSATRLSLAALALAGLAPSQKQLDLRLVGTKVVATVEGMVPIGLESDLTQTSRTLETKEAVGDIAVGDAKAGAFMVRVFDEKRALTRLALINKDAKGRLALTPLDPVQAVERKPEEAALWKRLWTGIDTEVLATAAKRTLEPMVTQAALKAPVIILICGASLEFPPLIAMCGKEVAGLAETWAATMLNEVVDVLVEGDKLTIEEGKALKTAIKGLRVLKVLLGPAAVVEKAVDVGFGAIGIGMTWADASDGAKTSVDVAKATVSKYRAAFAIVKSAK